MNTYDPYKYTQTHETSQAECGAGIQLNLDDLLQDFAEGQVTVDRDCSHHFVGGGEASVLDVTPGDSVERGSFTC